MAAQGRRLEGVEPVRSGDHRVRVPAGLRSPAASRPVSAQRPSAILEKGLVMLGLRNHIQPVPPEDAGSPPPCTRDTPALLGRPPAPSQQPMTPDTAPKRTQDPAAPPRAHPANPCLTALMVSWSRFPCTVACGHQGLRRFGSTTLQRPASRSAPRPDTGGHSGPRAT